MCESSYRQGRSFYSYKGQRGNNDETAFLGKIAEILFEEYLLAAGVSIKEGPLGDLAYDKPESNFNGDYSVLTPSGVKRIELKTKSINCRPLPSYEVGTTRISAADFFVFSRLNDYNGVLYLCGGLSRADFKAAASYRPKGIQVKNSAQSSFLSLGNEYLVKISELDTIDKLIKLWLPH